VIVGVGGIGVSVGGTDVGVGGADVPVSDTGVVTGDGIGPQLFKMSARMVASGKRVETFFMASSE